MKIVLYYGKAICMVVLWPFFMLVQRFRSEWESAIGSATHRVNMQTRRNIDLAVSARAQIIEVAIESSFQPLLELYLLLPFLIQRFGCLLRCKDVTSLTSLTDVFGSIQNIQFWSTLTSIISLAWSFTYYQSIKKRSTLDLGASTFGRILLLLANFLQICSRLFALVLYAYCFGPGNFWPMFLSVGIHIIIMAALHYLMAYACNDNASRDRIENDIMEKRFVDKIKTLYHCLINGICNIYLCNEIMKLGQEHLNVEAKQLKSQGPFSRHVIFDAIFFVENVLVVILSYVTLPNGLPVEVLICLIASQILGFIAKWIYHKHFHIWMNAFSL